MGEEASKRGPVDVGLIAPHAVGQLHNATNNLQHLPHLLAFKAAHAMGKPTHEYASSVNGQR